jgi:hypothetical protein
MPTWKVVFIMLFGILCLLLVFGTLIAPLALTVEENRWPWFAGLLFASICMGALFTLFLKSADRSFMQPDAKRNR